LLKTKKKLQPKHFSSWVNWYAASKGEYKDCWTSSGHIQEATSRMVDGTGSDGGLQLSLCVCVFFLTREGPGGPRSFIDCGGIKLQQGSKEKENYIIVLAIY
jgi:hypothetical protein